LSRTDFDIAARAGIIINWQRRFFCGPALSRTGSADFFCGEDGKLEERRIFSAQEHRALARNGQVIDPEMDMKREGTRPAPLASRLSRIMRWLMPESRQVTPPMRSVARELEEAFPSADI
jgi:hypothetical protein